MGLWSRDRWLRARPAASQSQRFDLLPRVKPHLVDVLHDVGGVVARDVERVEAEDGARQRREGDVQIDAQLLPARRVHKQVVVLPHLQVVGHLDDSENSDQERARDRDGGARERALPELRQRLRIHVEGREPHAHESALCVHHRTATRGRKGGKENFGRLGILGD